MIEKSLESDWKKFRAMVVPLRERYLSKRNVEIEAIFADESLTPTERFWTAQERMEEIGQILRSCLDGHSRSKMDLFMLVMYRHEMLMDEDLEGFSDEIRERVMRCHDF